MKDNSLPQALAWVSRITAVAMVMVLPGLGGWWLDQWLDLGFLSIVGFGLGLLLGLSYLLAMSRGLGAASGNSNDNADSSHKPTDD